MKLVLALPLAFALGALTAPALAATPIHLSRALNADATVKISNVSGTVTVHGWDRNQIEVTGSLGDGAKPLTIAGDADEVSIKVEAKSSGSGGWLHWLGGNKSMDPTTLDIHLPRGASLDVDVVSADATLAELGGGKISVDSVSGKVDISATSPELDIDSVSGNVRLAGHADEVDVDTVSGDVDAPTLDSRKATIETVSGDVRFGTGAVDSLDGSTVSGDLTVHAGIRGDGAITIQTMSGDVTLTLAAGTSARLQASTFSGDIASAFGAAKDESDGPGSKLNARVGDGDGSVSLETFSGDIRVERGSP